MGAGKRFFHWSFGQDYHRIKLYHSLRLGKIYELVFFSNPCLAFLLESNSPLENKLVVAHVAAHSDFLKTMSASLLALRICSTSWPSMRTG